ncbi:aldo/keto reductase [Streptomyces sp. NPDC021100]|uniref:aldo/keto reductase n=1 Tax=Streptomyces sp. NPDC021100 TaxID=3365114 RepID=UPI0037AEE059
MTCTLTARWGVMALGTHHFGADVTPRQAAALLDAFTAAGGRLIDTAPTYGEQDGAFHAERVIGSYLAATGAPLAVATKAGLDPTGQPCLRPETLYDQAHVSRDRLRRDHLDLFLLHRDDRTIPVSEVADVLHLLLDEGTVHAAGVSNWTPPRILALNHALATRGPHRLTVTSPLWSLARRTRYATDPELVEADAHHLELARRQRLVVMPFRTSALGFFTDAFTVGGLRHADYVRAAYATKGNLERRRRAQHLAAELGVTAHHIALAYLRAFDLPVIPVIGATCPQQIHAAARACVLHLTVEQRYYLTSAAEYPYASRG